MRIELSTPLLSILERIATSLESIDQTLKAPPEDFTTEDTIVNQAAEQVAEAKDRIPHGT